MNIDTVEKAERLVKAVKEAKTIITNIVAEWCGACQAWKPELESILKKNNVVNQIAKVDEKNLDMYNNVREKNGLTAITVEKYPTILEEKGPNNSKELNREEVISAATTVNNIPMSMATGDPTMNENPVSPVASVSPVSPPSLSGDNLPANNNANTNPGQVGGYGGLYPAIASTAYHLAPAGILLAAAAATFKCKKGRKGQKRSTRRK
jgi:thiol-disulfide isomerase/thioredoxin